MPFGLPTRDGLPFIPQPDLLRGRCHPFAGAGPHPRFDKADKLGPGAISRSRPFVLSKVFARVQSIPSSPINCAKPLPGIRSHPKLLSPILQKRQRGRRQSPAAPFSISFHSHSLGNGPVS